MFFRYLIKVSDRTGTVKDEYNSDEPPIIRENLMIVRQELTRYVDLRFIADIHIIDRVRMGI